MRLKKKKKNLNLNTWTHENSSGERVKVWFCVCGRSTLARDRPVPEPPAAAGTRFAPGISEGLSPEGTSHPWREAVWSQKSLDLQATFGVSGSALLQLAQVGNSFHSIWAASFARSRQLGPRLLASWAYEFAGLRLGIEVEFEIIPPLIFCFCDHSLVVVCFSVYHLGVSHLCFILFWGSQTTLEPLFTFKKDAQSKIYEKLYLGQNEDCSPRDSTSESSDELLRRGRREGQYMWFWWRGGSCDQALILQKIFC